MIGRGAEEDKRSLGTRNDPSESRRGRQAGVRGGRGGAERKQKGCRFFFFIKGGWTSIGVCNGLRGDNLPSPREVVRLYQSNGIGAMRIYKPDPGTLNALRRTRIKVMVGVEGILLSIGNEIEQKHGHLIVLAMKNTGNAIRHAGLEGKIMVSAAFEFNVFTTTSTPSQAKFRFDYMAGIVEFLAKTGNPLFVNIYPYSSYINNRANIIPEFALFTDNRDPVEHIYLNLFDAMVDSVYYALEKAGYPDVGVVVSESGWPSDGGVDTTPQNAQTYNQNLINHVVNGTPKRPGYLETYIYAMFNENDKGGDEIERNFGLFFPDKSPVYPISFH
ncbi:beta-1,3-glucanase precursor [Carex littledalei]|uniref:Beta-1,3-glucanase n=1 Tax=Carex littledalei TaxID=544730 RepID=A0A833W297_9POAL|nr:beta-1,3-glucanase precursor [Carex littledalei]